MQNYGYHFLKLSLNYRYHLKIHAKLWVPFWENIAKLLDAMEAFSYFFLAKDAIEDVHVDIKKRNIAEFEHYCFKTLHPKVPG